MKPRIALGGLRPSAVSALLLLWPANSATPVSAMEQMVESIRRSDLFAVGFIPDATPPCSPCRPTNGIYLDTENGRQSRELIEWRQTFKVKPPMRWYRPLLYLWVAPATLLGLSLVPIALLQGGSATVVRGVIEAHGGIITKLLRIGLPWVGSGAALTLGHVVWGCDHTCLDKSRSHERVHVAQYERWGPLFIPVYLMASFVAYVRGRNPYLDNPFEREAFDRSF